MTAPAGLWPVATCPYCRGAVRVDGGKLFPHTVSGSALLTLGQDRCMGSGTPAPGASSAPAAPALVPS